MSLVYKTETPIIGILSQEPYIVSKYLPKNSNYTSFIAASYVKYLESGGSRVIPVWRGQSREYYERVVKYTNGILFPGGGTYFNETNGYGVAAREIYNLAIEANDKGIYYPVWGICLGMQALIFSQIGTDIRIERLLKNVAVPLEFLDALATYEELISDFKDAVLQSNIAIVTKCLQMGIDVNVPLDDDIRAIHMVAEKCDGVMMRLLLRAANIDIDAKTNTGFTAMMIGCLGNCREVVQLLLKNKADPNLTTENGNTALHYACIRKNMGIVFDLLQYGTNINVSNVYDVTPLSLTVIDFPSISIAKYLLKKGAKRQGNKRFPLLLECALTCNTLQRLAIFRLLIARGMDLHMLHPIEHRNCLHYVAITSYLPLVNYLLKFNVEEDLKVRDASGRTPLQIAINQKNYAVYELFTYYIHRRQQARNTDTTTGTISQEDDP